MKKFWKALGVAALAAAVPIRFKKDDATGEKTLQSLLISVNVGPGEEGGTSIDINFGDGILNRLVKGAIRTRKESRLFTEDPEEAVLFADCEPESAVVEPQEPAAAEEPVQSAGEPEATEEDFDPDL